MSDSRFENVLRLEYPLFVKVLNDDLADKYVREIIELYNELKKEDYRFHTSIYKTYLEFAIAVNAVYKYLLLNKVKQDKALELLSEFCMNTINKTLDRLSFIQLAFHYSTNKAYLKLITISSIITLDSFKLANDLKEHKMDEELNKSMKECNVEEYFKYYHVEELMEIADIVEKSFDMFLDKNVNYNSGNEVIIRI
ncbi:hypothetical protein SH1V18_34060 [Vallitalea longa]|uniref:Uncharacterized protein n=1 Tax=Vallitalea longa TaxID=2936439 RepID=A0A9W5YE16_9FIRM|nr:hypothetical protein [Vallitalea longa]GKX30926.1 hypothetical protein SH1V18_34060 [Vallitalea longa]